MPGKPRKTNNGYEIKAFFTSSDGKYHSKYKSGFKKQKDATDWAIDFERKHSALTSNSDRLTLGEFLDKWIAIKENKLSPNTVAGYKVNIAKIKETLKDVPLERLRLDAIQTMLDGLKGKPNTIKYVQRTLHGALEYACRAEYIASNPSDRVELKPSEKFVASILDGPEMLRQINELKAQQHYLYAPVLLSALTGCRRGEVLGLKWSDIDFMSGTITIARQYTRSGHTGADFKTVKTKGSDRIIVMPKLLSDELKTFRKRQSDHGCIEQYVCAINGQLPSLNTITKNLNAFQSANKFVKCRFHDLRHSFAELQLEAGTDLKTLSGMLGHSKIGITADLYLGDNLKMKKAAADRLNDILTVKKKDNKKAK